jgi:ABC-type multidrug transport system ATPase subunit
MTLLALDRVSRSHRHSTGARPVLREVSLELDRGELVAVWGIRRCGRSTLLRVAAGIEPCDSGVVRFAGRELVRGTSALGGWIGYCRRGVRGSEARGVLDELLVAQLARGVPRREARLHALAALERVAAAHCAGLTVQQLDSAEAVRVSLARALALEPALLLVDDAIRGVEPEQRDGILRLLRSLADEGMGVLISTDDATGLFGADRALSLSQGALRGERAPTLAPVVPLRSLAHV